MSTILDALKKSERDRQLGKAPELHSLGGVAGPTPSEFPWLLVLVALLALGIGALAALLLIENRERTALDTPAAVTDVVPGKPRTAAAPQPEPAPSPSPSPEQAPSAGTLTPSSSPATVARDVTTAQTAPTRAPQLQAERDEERQRRERLHQERQRREQLAAAKLEADRERELLALSDLPQHERAQFPSLTFSFHVWSSAPKQRTIIINGLRVQEGEPISERLRLEEITQSGVILQWPPYRVFVPVLADW